MTTFIPTLSDLKCEIAFGSAPSSLSPVWTNVSAYLEAFSTTGRGRQGDSPLCDPCQATIRLGNSDGRFNADNPSGPYFGQIKANVKVRLSALFEAEWWYLFTGYADSWAPSNPGGSIHSVCELRATDRFKLIARRKNTGSTVQEQTDERVSAILLAGGYGATRVVPPTEFLLNPEGYNCRTVVERAYDGDNSLDSLQDMALAEGGTLFMDAEGILRMRSTRYRTDNVRATSSQVTLGNVGDAIPVEDDLTPLTDMGRMANYVTVTDCNGTVKIAPASETSTSITENEPLMVDIGNTPLLPSDAQDRVNDALALLQDPLPRYDNLTIDAYTNVDAMEHALKREIDDRVTVAVVQPGLEAGMSRDYFIEGIAFDVNRDRFAATFNLSPAGTPIAINTDGDALDEYLANYTEAYV